MAATPTPVMGGLTSDHTVYEKHVLRVRAHISRHPTAPASSADIMLYFSNTGGQPISNLSLQIAVPKTATLKMDPLSGSDLGAGVRDGVTQKVSLSSGVQADKIKFRYRISYNCNGLSHTDQGEFAA
jgi:uncharacterized membrane protein